MFFLMLASEPFTHLFSVLWLSAEYWVLIFWWCSITLSAVTSFWLWCTFISVGSSFFFFLTECWLFDDILLPQDVNPERWSFDGVLLPCRLWILVTSFGFWCTFISVGCFFSLLGCFDWMLPLSKCWSFDGILPPVNPGYVCVCVLRAICCQCSGLIAPHALFPFDVFFLLT